MSTGPDSQFLDAVAVEMGRRFGQEQPLWQYVPLRKPFDHVFRISQRSDDLDVVEVEPLGVAGIIDNSDRKVAGAGITQGAQEEIATCAGPHQKYRNPRIHLFFLEVAALTGQLPAPGDNPQRTERRHGEVKLNDHDRNGNGGCHKVET
jgi:hypothetical protein